MDANQEEYQLKVNARKKLLETIKLSTNPEQMLLLAQAYRLLKDADD